MSGTVDEKISTIESKDCADPQGFCRHYQTCVGKIHRQVGILSHELPHPLKVPGLDRRKAYLDCIEQLEQLVRSTWKVREETKGLGKHRRHSYQGGAPMNFAQGLQACSMPIIVLIDQSY